MPEFGACPVCSSTQYFLDNGMYFCEICSTALNDVSQLMDSTMFYDNEVEEEEIVPSPNAQNSRFSTNKKTVANKKYFMEYTSWEVYNYVLKGWVDELINIGVDPELKVVALQIWAKVLSHSKVAFFSTQKAVKPQLGVRVNNIDAKILYGIDDIKKNLFGIVHRNKILRGAMKKEKTANESQKASQKQKNLRKDLLKLQMINMEIEQEKATFESSQITLDTIGDEEKKRKHNTVNLNPATKKALDDAIKTQTAVSKTLKDGTLPLNFTTLIAVLRVSLIVIGADVLVSDLFRLSDEHILSLFNIEKVVPASILSMCDSALYRVHQHEPSLQSVSRWTMLLLKLMDIPYRPNLEQICSRYCEELQLPESVAELTRLLLQSFSIHTHLYLKRSMQKAQERSDGIAVACLIFVLKLLFSLDDVTERKQSEIAAVINKKIKKHEIKEPLLFEWKKWREYITCRKAVVGMFHYPTFLKLYQGAKLDSNLLLNHRQKNILPHSTQKPEFTEYISSVLKELDSDLKLHLDDTLLLPNLILRPSITPLSGYLKQLLTEHTDRIPPAVLTQLQQDFPSTSVKYLTDDEYLKKLSERCGVKISVSYLLDESLSIKKIDQIQRLDQYPTDNQGNSAYGKSLNAIFVPENSVCLLTPLALQIFHDRLRTCNIQLDASSAPRKTRKRYTKISEEPGKSDDSQIFHDRLRTCNIQLDAPSAPHKKRKRDTKISEEPGKSDDSTKSVKSLILNKMTSRYWVSHIKPWDHNVGDPVEFDIILGQYFPSSFVWLVKECALLLDCTPNDLYGDICAVENVVFHEYTIRNDLC